MRDEAAGDKPRRVRLGFGAAAEKVGRGGKRREGEAHRVGVSILFL